MDASAFTYDVALSFAGEQREYVIAVNEHLKAREVRTFYDEDHGLVLWGKNRTAELPSARSQEPDPLRRGKDPVRSQPQEVQARAGFPSSDFRGQ